MELFIIRHGHSMGDHEDRHQGHADFPLSGKGEEQAEALAAFIYRNYPLQLIYSSPLKRCLETAEIIAKPLQIPIHERQALIERDNGLLAGMLRTEALEKYPYPEGGRSYEQPLYEGESELSLRCRVEHFFAPLCRDQSIQRIGIVTHASVISQLFRCFLNLPNDCNVYLSTSDAAVHFWNIHQDYRQIIFNNYQQHLSHST